MRLIGLPFINTWPSYGLSQPQNTESSSVVFAAAIRSQQAKISLRVDAETYPVKR